MVLNLVHQVSTAHVEDLDVGVLPVIKENAKEKKINGIFIFLVYIYMWGTIIYVGCIDVDVCTCLSHHL